MKVSLCHRNVGVHSHIREAEIPGEFSDYCTPLEDEHRSHCYSVNEDLLLERLPEGFLVAEPRWTLLTVEFEWGGAGQSGLTRFRSWAKYFPAYVLNLHAEDSK